MTRKQTMRLLTMLLVCIILLNFIAQPKAEAIGGSLALALGGTAAAKAFLAFIMSCVAMGVTYATYDQAKAAYDHYIENSTMSTEDLRYIQQETWTGSYEGVTIDISDMKDAFVGWLTGLFGTLKSGINQTESLIINQIPFAGNYVQTSNIYYTRSQLPITLSYNGYLWTLEESDASYVKITMYNPDGSLLTTHSKTWYSYQSSPIHFMAYPGSTYMNVGVNNWTGYSYNTNLIGPYILQTYSITIAEDAAILNPEYTPQNRTFPAAPYLPYIDFDNEKVVQSISASGGTMEVYNGSYDQYLDDIVENATWEDIQGISAGTVPTTTLTETSEGLIIGEATAGIPYPVPDTTAPGEVLTGLGGIMGLLQGITNWIAQLWQLISGIFAIPEGLALDFSSLRLEGFKDKFPFSIPWDIYRAVAVFAKTPETPEFNIDIETDYLDINHSINLDPIDLPLRFARYVMSIFFIFFLASKTRDLIKW